MPITEVSMKTPTGFMKNKAEQGLLGPSQALCVFFPAEKHPDVAGPCSDSSTTTGKVQHPLMCSVQTRCPPSLLSFRFISSLFSKQHNDSICAVVTYNATLIVQDFSILYEVS
ncbi:hypothetical protein Anapl_05903 [Anas platyrhynchos]|uniref:Uncharacterized protein n=1 Tax=Anas platyrhynchos TaxID=8839 RepID=R0JU95_ANAPL|nr:hypothetical protein Anapl_05903 [Anas platyrhynchos]